MLPSAAHLLRRWLAKHATNQDLPHWVHACPAWAAEGGPGVAAELLCAQVVVRIRPRNAPEQAASDAEVVRIDEDAPHFLLVRART